MADTIRKDLACKEGHNDEARILKLVMVEIGRWVPGAWTILSTPRKMNRAALSRFSSTITPTTLPPNLRRPINFFSHLKKFSSLFPTPLCRDDTRSASRWRRILLTRLHERVATRPHARSTCSQEQSLSIRP